MVQVSVKFSSVPLLSVYSSHAVVDDYFTNCSFLSIRHSLLLNLPSLSLPLTITPRSFFDRLRWFGSYHRALRHALCPLRLPTGPRQDSRGVQIPSHRSQPPPTEVPPGQTADIASQAAPQDASYGAELSWCDGQLDQRDTPGENGTEMMTVCVAPRGGKREGGREGGGRGGKARAVLPVQL